MQEALWSLPDGMAKRNESGADNGCFSFFKRHKDNNRKNKWWKIETLWSLFSYFLPARYCVMKILLWLKTIFEIVVRQRNEISIEMILYSPLPMRSKKGSKSKSNEKWQQIRTQSFSRKLKAENEKRGLEESLLFWSSRPRPILRHSWWQDSRLKAMWKVPSISNARFKL